MHLQAPTPTHIQHIRIPIPTKFSPAQICHAAADKGTMSELKHERLCFALDYDLVRIYHPDSPVARKYPPDVVETRFQAISKAYDVMRGKSTMTGEVATSWERPPDPVRYRPTATRRRPHFDETVGDERWKERVLLGATVFAIVAFVMQTTVTRHTAMVHPAGGARTASSGPRDVLADEALAEPKQNARAR
ncbi:hypothetical protein JVU11DRAFT_2721 [Chiua virens]|nr:hypothetical protein JVU11DRAFT_2721 [Chiua virens]